MSIESRKETRKQYYYRHLPGENGTQKQYIGSTRMVATRVAIAMDEDFKAKLNETRDWVETEKGLIREIEKLDAQLYPLVRLWFYVWMLERGYCHRRNEWVPMEELPKMNTCKVAEVEPDQEVTHERLERLRKAANNGDADALAELKGVLREHPEIWKSMGDLMACTKDAMLHMLSPEDALHREVLRAKLDEQASNLVNEGSGTFLEQLLIDHLVLCNVRKAASGLGVMGQLTAKAKRGDIKFWSGRDDKAHRHFADAIKMLTETRRVLGLQKPNLLSPVERDDTQELATVEM